MHPGLPSSSFDAVARVVGPVFAERGRRYVRDGRVLEAVWDPDTGTMFGIIQGSNQRMYETTVTWRRRRDSLTLIGGECSCPMQTNCKHVAAVALSPKQEAAGADAFATADTRAPAPSTERAPAPRASPDWVRTLDRWTSGQPRRGGERLRIAPLGILLTVGTDGRGPGGSPELRARLAQPSSRGWINRDLDWRSIERWHGGYGTWRDDEPDGFEDAHVRIAKAIYALSTAMSQYGTYTTSARDLVLSDFAHPQLWDLLADAVAAGMPLRTGRAGQHAVTLLDPAELRIDVTRQRSDAEDLLARPGIWLDERPRDVIGFVGRPASGVILAPTAEETASAQDVDRENDGDADALAVTDDSGADAVRGEDARAEEAGLPSPAVAEAPALVLARLRATVPEPLCEAVLDRASTVIPAADAARFSTEVWPRLRRTAPVASSDGSYTPPRISPPTLILRIVPEDARRLGVLWGIRYDVDGNTVDASVDAPLDRAPWRDPTAEAALFMALRPVLGASTFSDGPVGRTPPEGLRSPSGELWPAAVVTGMDAVHLATRIVPALEDAAGVEVEVMGEGLADYRDVTDDLQISVGTHDLPEQRDWFGLDVFITIGEQRLPFGSVFEALAEGRTRMVLADGAHLSLESPSLLQLRDLIDEARTLQERPSGPIQISVYQADLWEQLAALGIVADQAERWRRQVEALQATPEVDAPAAPEELAAILRPYQQEGFAWLERLWRHDLGGILADDMGLGKTLQTLALMLHARRQQPAGAPPFLVIAPASVVHGWTAEAARFTPDLEVRSVDATLKKLGTTATNVAAGADVVITSHTRFRMDADSYRTVPWSGLIIDEAQAIKNHRSKLYGAVRRLDVPFTLAITGTPMENNLMELWSLLSASAPGLFPNPSRFKEHYLTPIERSGDRSALDKLRRRIRPVVLRRTKEEVAPDLPPKQVQLLEVELSSAHRRIYDTWLQRERTKVMGLLGDLDEHRFTVLRSLTMLRLASLHAGLVDDAHRKVASAKLDVLVEHLSEVVDGGHRALVFSQFTSFLALVRERLDDAGIEHVYLDGSTRDRQAVVERFKQGQAPVFVISLKAGGVGLNLTEADYCFLLDPWWNPATEAQAIDRAHRIGQTRKVMVYRLIAANTIEQKVVTLSTRKADLVDGVMAEGSLDGRLTAADLHELFS